MSAVKSLTKGSPAKLIFLFALPLMLGNVFQQFYTITDSLIISRSLGMNALSALGSADWYDSMIISVIQSAGQGFAILMAQQFGAGDEKSLQKTIAHSLILVTIITVLATVISVGSLDLVILLLQTPSEIAPMTKEYLFFKFSGLAMAMLLNYCSAVLRAFGNSRTPLFAMVMAAFVNIGLDLLFVPVLGFGIAGAAVATVIAQGCGGLVCLLTMLKLPCFHPKKEDFGRVEGLNIRLLSLCIPMMLQNMMISGGGMIIQSRVNLNSISFIAGYTATNKLYAALELAAVAYGFAMVTYIGQNAGARQFRRVRRGFWDAVWIALFTSVLIGVTIILLRYPLTQMFLNGEGQSVVEAGMYARRYLVILNLGLPVLYTLHIARCTLQGFGDTITPMLSGIAELAGRVATVFFGTAIFGTDAFFLAEIIAWIASDGVLLGKLFTTFKALPKEDAPSETVYE